MTTHLRIPVQRALALLCATLVFAACSGGATSTPTAVGSHGATAGKTRTSAVLKITIPKATKAAASVRHGQYVSPATTSMTVAATGTGSTADPSGFPLTVGLTPTSTGCSSTLASTECDVNLVLGAGTYAITITTYDASNNVLSAAQSIAFTVVAAAANVLPVTLGGVPTGLSATPLSAGYLRGDTQGLKLYGAGTQALIVVARDADGNAIVGPGAPAITVTPSSTAQLTVAGGSTSSPNQFTLTAPTSGSPAVVTPGSLSLAITATPVSGSGGSTVNATVPITIAHSAIYVSAFSSNGGGHGGIVDVFYDGNTATPNVTITNGIDLPYGVAVDTNGTLYVANQGTSAQDITEYPAGSSTATTTLSGLQYPTGVAVDGSGTLYASYTGTGPGGVAVYPAGSSSPSTTLGGTYTPYGEAIDALGTLYVANVDELAVTEYTPGSSTPTTTLNSGLSYPKDVAVDAAGTLYVSNSFSYNGIPASIVEFAGGSTSPTTTLTSGINTPYGIAIDAAGTLYVVNNGTSSILSFPAGSTAATAPTTVIPASVFGSDNQVNYIAVVPSPTSP